MPKLTWHGHSCFTLRTEETTILFDPWLDDNPVADIASSDVRDLDYLLISHGHFDHLGDAVAIARQTGATIVTTFELASFCGSQGVENIHGMNIGGGYDFPFGRVKLTAALHTGSVEGDAEGAYTTDCVGFLLTLKGGSSLYHAGDTALITDMQLLRGQVDVALLPIGDNYTMGPADAARAVDFIRPRTVIPMHYNALELTEQDPEDFREAVGDIARVEILSPGGSYDF
ncbi:MAG TPA: metal-dependent hydrolase [Longimicrobiaceae bacterium]|nr:metal-dependent hydrolase [Longimicrobiaceae bacterium]